MTEREAATPGQPACRNCRHPRSDHDGRTLYDGRLVQGGGADGCSFLETPHHTCPCGQWLDPTGQPAEAVAALAEAMTANSDTPPTWNDWADDILRALTAAGWTLTRSDGEASAEPTRLAAPVEQKERVLVEALSKLADATASCPDALMNLDDEDGGANLYRWWQERAVPALMKARAALAAREQGGAGE